MVQSLNSVMDFGSLLRLKNLSIVSYLSTLETLDLLLVFTSRVCGCSFTVVRGLPLHLSVLRVSNSELVSISKTFH